MSRSTVNDNREEQKRNNAEQITHSSESSLQEVTHCRSRSLGLCVAVLDTGKLQKPLRGRSGNDTSSSWSGDETAHDRSDLPADLRGDCVGFTELSTPVTSSDRNDGKFCKDDGTSNGGSDFLRALDTQTNMAIEIADSNEGFESCTLTGTCLLLNGHDLHDLVFEFWEEKVDDLELLDWEREEVDFLHGFDLSILHETAKFCDGNPLIP